MDTSTPPRGAVAAMSIGTSPGAGSVGRVVDALVSAQLLDPGRRDQALAVVVDSLRPPAGVPAGPPAGPTAGTQQGFDGPGGPSSLVEVLAYLGAALVLAAGALFGVSWWDDLRFGAQVAVLAASALGLGGGGVVVVAGQVSALRHREAALDVRRRLAGTLLTTGALSLAVLVGFLVEQVTGTPDHDEVAVSWPVVAGSAVGLVAVVAGRRLADSAVGVLGSFGAVTTLVGSVVASYDVSSGLGPSLVLLALAVGWLVVTERFDHHAPTLGRVLGSGLALWAAHVLLVESSSDGGAGLAWLGYLLTVLVAVVGTVAYLRLAAWPYLAVSVLAVTIVVPEAVADWTDGGLGAIGGVLLTGLTLLLASGLAARLHRGTR